MVGRGVNRGRNIERAGICERLFLRADLTEQTSGLTVNPMQIWFEFYAVIGGATATLLGLLFVAVSINAPAILSEAYESSKRLAEQALQNYLAVLLVSLLALFPSLKLSELGFATLGLTAVWGVWVLMRLYLALKRSRDVGWRLQPLRRQFYLFSVRNAGIRRLANGSKPQRQPHLICNCDHRSIVLSYKGILGVNA